MSFSLTLLITTQYPVYLLIVCLFPTKIYTHKTRDPVATAQCQVHNRSSINICWKTWWMREVELKCLLVSKGGTKGVGKEVMTFFCCLCRHYTVRNRKGIQRRRCRMSQSIRAGRVRVCLGKGQVLNAACATWPGKQRQRRPNRAGELLFNSSWNREVKFWGVRKKSILVSDAEFSKNHVFWALPLCQALC